MRRIYKYPLKIVDEQTLKLPARYKLLSLQVQDDVPCVWVLVDPNAKAADSFTVKCYGTGHPVESDLLHEFDFFATTQHDGGRLIFHWFVDKE